MPEALELFKNELDTKLSGLDPSKDNGDAARLGTGIVRAADYFKQKVPSLALFLLPGYFPPSIEKEATRLVREAHSDYEVG